MRPVIRNHRVAQTIYTPGKEIFSFYFLTLPTWRGSEFGVNPRGVDSPFGVNQVAFKFTSGYRCTDLEHTSFSFLFHLLERHILRAWGREKVQGATASSRCTGLSPTHTLSCSRLISHRDTWPLKKCFCISVILEAQVIAGQMVGCLDESWVA